LAVRVSLTERISIEGDGVVVDEERFPGRQGRLVFAYLLAAHGRPVPRDDLAEALWGDAPPARWEKALSVLVSKLRTLLNDCGVDGGTALTSAFGCYELTLPPGSWIDVSAADEAATAAELALAAGDLDGALDNASTAAALARRTFLPGEDGRWVDERRAELREILVRALECIADANRLSGDPAASVRAADELVTLDPFRDRGYRLLMQAQSAAGNDAEALRTYERCRALLADELGAYPSSETEAVYLEILRGSPGVVTVELDPPEVDGPTPPSPPPSEPHGRDRRKLAALLTAVVLLAGAAAIAVAMTSRDDAPLEVVPNSVVRIDPDTFEPKQVVPVGGAPDLVVVAGGYVWVTHWILRESGTDALRNAGDRMLTRIDPSTGESKVVGGGLAPCGLTADPSGDVWVANCVASGPTATVVRVDAKTLSFGPTWTVPNEPGYYRGLAYGGGSLWAGDVSGVDVARHRILQLDSRAGAKRWIPLSRHAGAVAWSEGYGDLWFTSFDLGGVSRLHEATGHIEWFPAVAIAAGSVVVDGDTTWVGDWAIPAVVRLPAVGPGRARRIDLSRDGGAGGVTTLSAGEGGIWATVRRDAALWRIDPRTNHATRISFTPSSQGLAAPIGVAVGDGEVWVTMRTQDGI
jgi:SARP family transcriptional regulator, regulator of embCAB operon